MYPATPFLVSNSSLEELIYKRQVKKSAMGARKGAGSRTRVGRHGRLVQPVAFRHYNTQRRHTNYGDANTTDAGRRGGGWGGEEALTAA